MNVEHVSGNVSTVKNMATLDPSANTRPLATSVQAGMNPEAVSRNGKTIGNPHVPIAKASTLPGASPVRTIKGKWREPLTLSFEGRSFIENRLGI
jgi:hypothetical protein